MVVLWALAFGSLFFLVEDEDSSQGVLQHRDHAARPLDPRDLQVVNSVVREVEAATVPGLRGNLGF